MENLFIEKTELTPMVSFDLGKNHFEIKGESMPESPIGFYKPVIQWLENFFSGNKNTEEEILADFRMEYFNSASSNNILDILKIFEKAIQSGHRIKIQWHYDHRDSDIKESGEEMKKVLNISSFELVEETSTDRNLSE